MSLLLLWVDCLIPYFHFLTNFHTLSNLAVCNKFCTCNNIFHLAKPWSSWHIMKYYLKKSQGLGLKVSGKSRKYILKPKPMNIGVDVDEVTRNGSNQWPFSLLSLDGHCHQMNYNELCLLLWKIWVCLSNQQLHFPQPNHNRANPTSSTFT